MFTLRIGTFEFWITIDKAFSKEVSEYFLCKLVEWQDGYPVYVHLARDVRFPFFELLRPASKEDKPMQHEHWNHYAANKDQGMPLWKLHASVVEQVVTRLHELSLG